jgi:single-strand DNA-binding protein
MNAHGFQFQIEGDLSMKGINLVILIGNLGRDPEVLDSSKTKTAKLSLATGSNFKNAQGEWQERTEWHEVTLFGHLAENAQRFLKKGSRVFVEGRLHTSSWVDEKTGQKRFKTEVIAHELQVLGDGRKPGGFQAAASAAPVDDCPF